MTDQMLTVQGRCPACGWASLFLGDGGHVTCSRLECPKPEAADELLAAKPAPAPADGPLRQRIAEALLTTHHREHGYHADCVVCAGDVNGLATAVLAVQPELDRLARNCEDRARRITGLTAERDQLRARLAAQEAETMWQLDRAEQAEAAADRMKDAAALHRKGLISTAELYAVIGPASAEPTHAEPCSGRPCAGTGCSHEQAAAQLIAHDQAAGLYPDTTAPQPPTPTITTGLVVQPYRNDKGQPAWVFRCWGTDTCDGWLSLDHTSEQSAQRARDRHVAEEHAEEQPGT